MFGSSPIEFGARGITLFGEASDKHLADGDPVASRDDFGASADVFEDISDVLHLGNGMVELGHAGIGGMAVGIDEAREDEFAFEVDDFGFRAAKVEDGVIVTDLEDAALANGDGFVDGELGIDGGDFGVMEDEVGFGGEG